jgi:hypothetical protein
MNHASLLIFCSLYILDGSCVLDDEDIILRYAKIWLYKNYLPLCIHLDKVISFLLSNYCA